MVFPTMLRDAVQDKLKFSNVVNEICRTMRTAFYIMLVHECES